MFVHNEHLRTHGPFGLSIIVQDEPASGPSVAAILVNRSMQPPIQHNACIGIRDVGVPGVRGSGGSFTFGIGSKVATPKALSVAAVKLATPEGDVLRPGDPLPEFDKMLGITCIRSAQLTPEQLAGGKTAPRRFHVSIVAATPPPAR